MKILFLNGLGYILKNEGGKNLVLSKKLASPSKIWIFFKSYCYYMFLNGHWLIEKLHKKSHKGHFGRENIFKGRGDKVAYEHFFYTGILLKAKT